MARVRQIDFKLVDRGDFDAVRYDWEVVAEGVQYIHKDGHSLRHGWIRWKGGRGYEIDDSKIVESLTYVTRKRRAKYPDGRARRTSDGIIELSYKGCIWRRGSFFRDGTSEPSKEWSKLGLKEYGEEWRPVKREDWDTLTEWASGLLTAVTDTVAPITGVNPSPQPSPYSPAPQESTRQKRTKHGIKIYSSDGEHFFYFGCWPSRKYSGRYSIRLGVAGKRMVYTIGRADLDAMLWEIQRLLPVQTTVPQIVGPHAEPPQNPLHQVRTA